MRAAVAVKDSDSEAGSDRPLTPANEKCDGNGDGDCDGFRDDDCVIQVGGWVKGWVVGWVGR